MLKEVKTSSFLYVLLSYGFCIAILYQLAYWSTFNINIFQFISIRDLVNMAIFPITIAFFPAIIGLFFTNLSIGKIFPPGGERDTSIGKFLNDKKCILILIYLCLLLLIYLFGSSEKWFLLPGLIAAPISVSIGNSDYWERLLPSNYRYIIIYIIIMLPFYSYGLGKYNSSLILENKSFQYITSDEINLNTLEKNSENTKILKYLGKAGNYLFFLNKDNSSTIMVNLNNLPVLNLKKFIVAPAMSI